MICGCYAVHPAILSKTSAVFCIILQNNTENKSQKLSTKTICNEESCFGLCLSDNKKGHILLTVMSLSFSFIPRNSVCDTMGLFFHGSNISHDYPVTEIMNKFSAQHIDKICLFKPVPYINIIRKICVFRVLQIRSNFVATTIREENNFSQLQNSSTSLSLCFISMASRWSRISVRRGFYEILINKIYTLSHRKLSATRLNLMLHARCLICLHKFKFQSSQGKDKDGHRVNF
jgi:hypothetical protein